MVSLRKKADKIVLLPVGELSPNPMQPRRSFDPDALRQLAESIRLHGLLQPVTVRPAEPLPFPDNVRGASFEIIAGERRWRAAKLAGLEKIPCVIRDANRRESAELALVENLQRSDLGPFEEAEAIRNLLLMTSMTQSELAAKLSISSPALSNKLRLLKLSDGERRLITEKGLGERHARAILRIRDPEQRREAILRAADEGLTASETEKLADALNGILAEPEKQKPTEPTGAKEDTASADTSANTSEEKPEAAENAGTPEAKENAGAQKPGESPDPPERDENAGEPQSAEKAEGRKPDEPPAARDPAADAAPKPQRIALIQDVRFFFNTLDRATALLREAGFPTEDDREETEDGYTIRIFVPKTKARV